MGETQVTKDAIQAPSMGALVQKVTDTPNAIGYASFGITKQNEGKLIPLKVDGVEATEANILDGYYYNARPLIIVKNGDYTAIEQSFIDYILSDEGLKTIDEMGFIPVSQQ